MEMRRPIRSLLVAATAAFLVSAGCLQPTGPSTTVNRLALRDRAMDCLRAAVVYRHNPVVRVEAVEALESADREEALPLIRGALRDEHPAVRFAACATVGRLKDATSVDVLRELAADEDPSVQLAALFALHRLGDTARSGRIPSYLLAHEDVAVRRNAALLLGLLGEPSAKKPLARAMRDRDAGVRHHALEGMARLGNHEARQELVFMTNAGVGTEEVFAINALAATGDPTYRDTFRYKLANATHLETRLAAARALGKLGVDEGFRVALSAVREDRPRIVDVDDPPEGQVLRVNQLAAAALGAIGRVEALPTLASMLEDPRDPRKQVSAARAILDILEVDRRRALSALDMAPRPGP